jgi:RNA polymerase sigma factor (sigma-70 family)
MRKLVYFFYIEEVVDWRVEALQKLEHAIVCKAAKANIHHHTADDLAQELRILLWNNLPSFNREKSSLATWANRVMENSLKDIYKTECMTQKRKNHLAASFEDWMLEELEMEFD